MKIVGATIHQSQRKVGATEVEASQRELIARLQAEAPSNLRLEFGRFVVAASLLLARITDKIDKVRERALQPVQPSAAEEMQRARADRLATALRQGKELVRDCFENYLRQRGEEIREPTPTMVSEPITAIEQRIETLNNLLKEISTEADLLKSDVSNLSSVSTSPDRVKVDQIIVELQHRLTLLPLPQDAPPESFKKEIRRLKELFQANSTDALPLLISLVERAQTHRKYIEDRRHRYYWALSSTGKFGSIQRNGTPIVRQQIAYLVPYIVNWPNSEKFASILLKAEAYFANTQFIERTLLALQKSVEEAIEKKQQAENALERSSTESTALLAMRDSILRALDDDAPEALPPLPKTPEGAAAIEILRNLKEEVARQLAFFEGEQRHVAALADTSDSIRKAKTAIHSLIALHQNPALPHLINNLDRWLESIALAEVSEVPAILSPIIIALSNSASSAPSANEERNMRRESSSLEEELALEAVSGSSEAKEALQLVLSWLDETDKLWTLAEGARKMQSLLQESSESLSRITEEDEKVAALKKTKEATICALQKASSILKLLISEPLEEIDSQALLNRIELTEESALDETIAAIGAHFLASSPESKSWESLSQFGTTLQMQVKQWGVNLDPNFPNQPVLLVSR